MGIRDSRNIIVWFFLALFLISLVLLCWLFSPFFSVIVLAAVITGIFKPLWRYLQAKTNASAASFITCLLIFIILFIPISLFVGILSGEAYGLYLMGKNAAHSNQIKEIIENNSLIEKADQFLSTFNIHLEGDEINKGISEAGKVVGLFLYEQASAIASNVFNFFIYFFLMLLVIYYLLMDGDRLVAFIMDLSPLPNDQDEKLIGKFKDMAGAILIGNGLGGLIQGVAGGLVFYVFGFKSSFLWGVIMALLAFLPIIGIGIVFIPATIYLFIIGRIGAGLAFILIYVLLSGGIEYIFKPRLVGHRVRMHTLLVFFSIIGGLKLFGILGIIYGPLVVTAFLTLVEIYHVSYENLVAPDESENAGAGEA